MRKIYKYIIPEEFDFYLEIEPFYNVLSVQLQNGKPVIWCSINVSAIKERVWFTKYYTGDSVSSSAEKHIGSYQKDGLVYHVYSKS